MTLSIEPLGECALLIQLGERINLELNACAVALANTLREAGIPGVFDVAPAYASVCVRHQPHVRESVIAMLSPLLDRSAPGGASPATLVEIPVRYGGDFGPDLESIAVRARLDARAVIARHSGCDYRVAMLGFAPGFPYLLGLDAALHAPRRANPRTRVPAGSGAIGGAQTGIYPRELPGGWNIIGRTPLQLFDAAREPPALLVPGQAVRFRAIDADEFAALSS